MHRMAFNGAVQKHVIVGDTQEIHGEKRWGKAVRVVTQEDSFWIVNIGELSTSSLNGGTLWRRTHTFSLFSQTSDSVSYVPLNPMAQQQILLIYFSF